MNMPTQLHEEDVKALEQEKPQSKTKTEPKTSSKNSTRRNNTTKATTKKAAAPQPDQAEQLNQDVRVYDTIVIGAGIAKYQINHYSNL